MGKGIAWCVQGIDSQGILSVLQEEAEWNELLQGGIAEEGNAGADGAPAAAPGEEGAPAAEAGGAAEAALISGGELPSGQEAASSDATAAPDRPGALTQSRSAQAYCKTFLPELKEWHLGQCFP